VALALAVAVALGDATEVAVGVAGDVEPHPTTIAATALLHRNRARLVAGTATGCHIGPDRGESPLSSMLPMGEATAGTYVSTGEFTRDQRFITTRITADGRDGFPVEPGRYRLVVSRACPWAHRSVIVRRLLGLEKVLSMGIAGPTHDARSWTFDLDPGGRDPVLGIERLQEAYLKRFPGYDRGIIVPAIVDIPTGAVVTNDFHQITLDLATEWREHFRSGAPELYPEPLRDEMDKLMGLVFGDVNNGVYRCGFAGTQDAYDKAYWRLFHRLDWLSERLEGRRYLMGDTITEADVRLFTTLVRFDAVYHGLYKCNRQKLAEMPVLWSYARDLFQTPGFGDTVDFDHIKRHYYVVQRDLNPTGIVPLGPDLDGWLAAHGRERLGGRPFGDGTPPPPPPAAETVPAGHTPLAA
jgi:putative glutathione S-transferase